MLRLARRARQPLVLVALCPLALLLAAAPAPDAPAPAPADPAAPAPAAPAPAPATTAPATPAAAATPAAPAAAAPSGDAHDAFPEPSPYSIDWDLKFEHKTPRRITVDDPKTGKRDAYWYITYTVTNPTDKPVEFMPNFGLLLRNGDGKMHWANSAVPPRVFEAIFRREGNKYLESPRKIQGALNPGEEQARDGVAIWPEPQLRMGTFDVFVGGLSGEYVIMKKVSGRFVPVDRRKAAEELKGVPEEDRLTLRKTLQVTFQIPGDNVRPGEDPVLKKSEKWIMR